MSAKINIPAPLRELTSDKAIVEASGNTIDEILTNLGEVYPGFRERIYNETGELRRFINIFVDGQDIRFKEGVKTTVAQSAEISIIPAIAGG